MQHQLQTPTLQQCIRQQGQCTASLIQTACGGIGSGSRASTAAGLMQQSNHTNQKHASVHHRIRPVSYAFTNPRGDGTTLQRSEVALINDGEILPDQPMASFPRTVMLLGSGELGKEVTIAAQRLGCRVIACDRYAEAPAMQVADVAEVLPMTDAGYYATWCDATNRTW